MKNVVLSCEKGGRASEAAVLAIPSPEFTETWRPFSHRAVLEAVGRATSEWNLSVARKEYGLGSGGATMFAIWEIGQKDLIRYVPAVEAGGRTLAIGIRNSVNKALSIGLCVGERVFVCDNLAFSSTVVVFRRHTGSLSADELARLAWEAISSVLCRFQEMLGWEAGLARRRLGDLDLAMAIRAAVELRILPQAEERRVEALMGVPGVPRVSAREPYPRTLGGFYGAAIEALGQRERLSPLGYYERNVALNAFVDGVVPALVESRGVADLPRLWEQAKAEAARRVSGMRGGKE